MSNVTWMSAVALAGLPVSLLSSGAERRLVHRSSPQEAQTLLQVKWQVKLSIKIMSPVTSTRLTSSPAPAYKSLILRAITLFSSWGLLGSRNVKKLWRHSKRCCWTCMVTSCDSKTESALNPSGWEELGRWQLTTLPSLSLRLSSKKRPSMFGGNWQPMANKRICSICMQGKLITETVLHFS